MRKLWKTVGPSSYELQLRDSRSKAIDELRRMADRASTWDRELIAAILANAQSGGFDGTVGLLKSCLMTMGEQRFELDRLSPKTDRNGQTLLL